ncbi:MAG: hypothetical protein FJ280_29485 [Planctomycetes bacterium]|nr:hypothetical protein [Planctomycetota bacterium]
MLPYDLKGARLPALERNELKYRALEMVLILFRVEHLRGFVLESIRATDRFHRPTNPRIPLNAKKVYEKARAVLIADGILTQAESDEIQSLVDYRNTVAHEIQSLTCGIADDARLAQYYAESRGIKYDDKAVAKLQHYHDKIEEGFTSKGYIMSLPLDWAAFAAAERTYEQELHRLRRKITRQVAIRNEEIQKLNAELSAEISGTPLEAHPSHPRNKAANGTLTKHGVETCYRLFDKKRSTLAVAHLMRISYRSAASRRKAWEEAGGRTRHRKMP